MTTFAEGYEILGKLGEGGFSVVYEARQLATGQRVALKIMRLPAHGGAARAEVRAARFLREARLCAELHHPNIVQLVDAGQTPDGSLYSVFAFAPGDDLGAVLAREGALAPREAQHLMLEVLDALACAHARGVVHRDLKPGNIMVIPTGARRNALVLDFGIGAVVGGAAGAAGDPSSRLTSTGDTLGTPGYGAPEQWRGVEPSPRADLFSWGLVLLECLTGKPVYAGATHAEIVYHQLGPDPVPIPPALARHPLGDILRRATQKDAAARDVTAHGLLEALDACDLRGLTREGLLGLPSHEEEPRWLASIDTITVTSDAAPGERRQLTALGCNLRVIPGAAAGNAPGDEARDDALRAALGVCAAIARTQRGRVTAVLGDDLLVYFGYPQAAEDDARRAARAALAIPAALAAENARLAALGIRVEVGLCVHTGVVVAGDLQDMPGRSLVAGSTPRLTATLARAAGPGTIVVTADAHSFLRSSFHLAPDVRPPERGTPDLYRLLEERTVPSHGPTPDGAKVPLVGRQHELDLLLDRWRRVQGGAGQTSLVTGEPGIGKSRLARELRVHLAGEAHTFLEARCSPDTQNNALFPIADLLGRALGLDQEPGPAAKTARLEAQLAAHGFALGEAMPLFLALLSLPLGAVYAPLDVSRPRQKTLTLGAAVSLLAAMADKSPLLLLVEDLQWADPTTLELLTQLVREAPSAPMYLLLTARPEFTPSFSTTGMLQLPLGRLDRAQIEAMLGELTAHKALPATVVEQVVRRTDGVPLFVEELTRMVVESGALVEREDRYELTGPLADVEMRGTLRALLTVRLDRLGRAKETAQVAAALGREFSVDVLSAVSALGPAAVAEDLEQLMGAGLLVWKRRVKDPVGVFKHALVRDAAYESLGRAARERAHARIARVLEERFPEVVDSRPDSLAHHHAAAGELREAARYAQRAAEQGLSRSAYAEAMKHASRALRWTEALPPEALSPGERADAQLSANGVTLQALMSTQGWASPAVRALAETSRALLHAGAAEEHTVSTLFALYMHYHVASDRAQCRRVADDLVDFAERIGDASLLCVAATAKGVNHETEGRFLEAERWLTKAQGLYEPAQGRREAAVFGLDCRVWAGAMLARVEHAIGRTTRALQIAEEAIDWAREIRHVPSLGIALLYLAQIHQMAGDAPAAQRRAAELLAAAKTYGLPAFEGYGAAIASWAAGDLPGVAAIIDVLRSLGCNLILTYYGSFLADIEAGRGHVREAIAHLETCLSLCEETGERCFEAELARRRALCELLLPEPDRGLAHASFQRAYRLAREQGAARFEAAAIRDCQRAFGGDDLADRLREIFDRFPDLAE